MVRPPIVLGEADRDGFEMFKGIAQWGVHLVPSLFDDRVSVIHAEDLAAALLMAANHGRRILPTIDSNTGIYFAAADEAPTYADLGRMIGKALGRERILVIRNLKTSVWCIAAINEIIAQIRRRPHILSLDKAREATAGSWTCSADALRTDTGFEPACSLQQRLDQTARWYVEQGWLRTRDQLDHPTRSGTQLAGAADSENHRDAVPHHQSVRTTR
jgi:nucleoside-diphosphate-sugar epimerase